MARYGIYRIASDDRARCFETLARLFARLRSLDEARALLFDLVSLSEATMLMRRLVVARLLLEGVTYREIKKIAGTGQTLVRDVARRLNRSGRGFAVATARLSTIDDELREEIRRAEDVQNPETDEAHIRRFWRTHWPELVARDIPKLVRDIAAARSRRRDAKKRRRSA